MLKSKKLTAVIFSALLCLAALSGCGESKTESQPSAQAQIQELSETEDLQPVKDKIAEEAQKTDNQVKMLVWCSKEETEFTQSVIDDFCRKYEDSRYEFDIRIENRDNAASGGKIMESPQDGADVFNLYAEQIEEMERQKILAPVDELYKDRVISQNTENSVTMAAYKDILYAFPQSPVMQSVLFYDKRILHEEDITSLDTIIEKSAAQNKNVLFPLNNKFYAADIFLSAGIKMTFFDWEQTENAVLDSEEGRNAAEAIRHLLALKGMIWSVYNPGWKANDIAAEIAIMERADEIAGEIGRENLGIAPLPAIFINGEQVPMHCMENCHVTGVNAYSKYPSAAQALAYFLNNTDNQLKRYLQTSVIPTNIAACQNESVQSDTVYRILQKQSPYVHLYTQTISSEYFSGDMDSLLEKIRLSADESR